MQAGAADPANGQAGVAYPANGQAGAAYPASGQAGSSAIGGQAASSLQNAANMGIQNNLQKGLNRGAGALDRLGRKVGLPGLGSLLSSPNAQTNPTGAQPYSSASPPTYLTPPMFQGTSDKSGKAAWEEAGRRARQSQDDAFLRSAQQAEARGDWNQAAFAYRQVGADDKQLNMKWAYCAVQLLNQDYAGQITHVDPKHTESELFAAFASLKDSDKGNAAWNYLSAVYWCSENRTKEWNYLKAWNQLLDALKCPRITPSIREKCLALQKHITPAKELQANDMKRAVFNMEQDLVWNVEHPYIAGTEHRHSTSKIDDTHELVTTWSRDYLNTELWAVETYPDCKRDLREKFPAFKNAWLRQLDEMIALPN